MSSPIAERDPSADAQRFHLAHGGHNSHLSPVAPNGSLSRRWRPSQHPHWLEQTRVDRLRSLFLRLAVLVQLIASTIYLQYRARFTIGKNNTNDIVEVPAWLTLTLQILFFAYEIIVTLLPLFGLIEVWNVTQRNAVDLNRIPSEMMPSCFGDNVLNYPSVAVIVPCYKEDADLVLAVVRSACKMAYPKGLIDVFLCDDGRDPAKQAGIELLRMSFDTDNRSSQHFHHRHHRSNSNNSSNNNIGVPRVHYITRADNQHAKPGNVNHCIQRHVTSDLIVQLDADFLALPNLLQRLIPYFLVWNPITHNYDMNPTLAFVQAPQFYRNLSPYDSDPLDQRNAFFFGPAQRGRDWFNGATMVGTVNLISRRALQSVGYFPVYTAGDDTALSLLFHAAGYRSYYVPELLATGLAPHTLRGHFAQKARWQKSDFEILFSKHGPLFAKGLTMWQRLLYVNVGVQRFRALLAWVFDILMIVVLVTGFSIVDVSDKVTFIVVLIPHLLGPVLVRTVLTVKNPGIHKTLAASDFFEVVFRYGTLKALLRTLFKRKKAWKVAEKRQSSQPSSVYSASSASAACVSSGADQTTTTTTSSSSSSSDRSQNDDARDGDSTAATRDENDGNDLSYEDDEDDDDSVPRQNGVHASRNSGQETEEQQGPGVSRLQSVEIPIMMASESEPDTLDTAQSQASSTEREKQLHGDVNASAIGGDISNEAKQPGNDANTNELNGWPSYSTFVLSNLKRVWYNILMTIIFVSALVICIVRLPHLISTTNSSSNNATFDNSVPLALAVGYTVANLIPHLLVVVLCFKRNYIAFWEGNPEYERCDGKVDQLRNGSTDNNNNGKSYVPMSYISVLAVAREIIVLMALVYTVVASTGVNNDDVAVVARAAASAKEVTRRIGDGVKWAVEQCKA